MRAFEMGGNKNDKSQYKQIAKDNLENVTKMIRDVTSSYVLNPELISEVLEFSSRFYNYSVNNRLLIHMQNEHATFVQSFQGWKKMGYLVKKGQHGSKILVPHITTYLKTPEKWTKLSDADPKLVEQFKNGEIESTQVRSYGVGNVFDISQTNCPKEDYPKFYDMGYKDANLKAMTQGIENYCKNYLNTDVVNQDVQSIALKGLNYVGKNKIVLNELLEDSERLSVIVHEMAHQQIHQDISSDKSIPQKEFEADAYAVMVNAHLDIENTESRKWHMTKNFKLMVEQMKNEGMESSAIDAAVKDVIGNVFKIYDETIQDIKLEVDKALDQNSPLQSDMTKSRVQGNAKKETFFDLNRDR